MVLLLLRIKLKGTHIMNTIIKKEMKPCRRHRPAKMSLAMKKFLVCITKQQSLFHIRPRTVEISTMYKTRIEKVRGDMELLVRSCRIALEWAKEKGEMEVVSSEEEKDSELLIAFKYSSRSVRLSTS